MTPDHREAAQRTLDTLYEVDDLTDGWRMGSVQMRQKSMTVTVHFEKKVDVMKATNLLPSIFEKSPALLASWLREVVADEADAPA